MEYHYNKGAALISALLIMALTASVATVMAVSLRIQVRHTTFIINADQAYLAAQLVEDWSIATLNQANKLKITSDKPQLLYYVFPPTEINGIKITGFLQDQQGLFNINALSNANNQIYFIRLLKAVEPTISDHVAEEIAIAISNWLMPANSDKPDLYLTFKPSYRAAHRLMVSPSELRLVAGITAKRYELLKPYITVLPIQNQRSSYQINVNSAPIPVLMTLTNNINLYAAQAIVAYRKEIGLFKSTGDFSNYLSQINIKTDENTQLDNLITVSSNYFLATGYAQKGNQQLTLYTLLQISDGSNNYQGGQDQPVLTTTEMTGVKILKQTRETL